MSYLRTEKIVSSLPEVLTADTIYFVRTGVGYLMYVSDTTGTITYEQNVETNATIIAGLNAASRLIQTQRITAQIVSRGQM
jgi:hypothetical protein